MSSVRLDKWLWAARFYKTRSLAQQAIEGGKILYQGLGCKSSKNVEPGAKLQLRLPQGLFEIEVKALSDTRRGSAEAALLYQETEQSIQRRQLETAARQSEPQSDGRPNKKHRRQLLALKQRQFE